MPKINTIAELRQEIQMLEKRHTAQGQMLKKRFGESVETFNLANLIKSGFSGDLLNTVFAMVAGFMSRRLLLGSTGTLFNKLLGNILQFVVTSLIIKKNQKDSPA